jgi:hypothetical protein
MCTNHEANCPLNMTVPVQLSQANMAQKAVDCCAQLNEWALCVRVATEHGIPVENLLSSRLSKLKMHGRKADEVNLYKSAAQHHMSALALADLAKASIVRISSQT